jgi:hypothetical protein
VTNFEAVLTALAKANVTFVVVGGYAAMLLGSALVTQDLDICYERTPENMERLVSALRPYHPRLRGAPESLPFLFDVQTLSNGMNFTLATDLGDIDLLGHLSGLGEFPLSHSTPSPCRCLAASIEWLLSIPSSVRKGQRAGTKT